MRLWHKDLIPLLPKKQLLGQWRECCAIAKRISLNGASNHILVNRVIDYPMADFYTYGYLVCREMLNRGYKCDFEKFEKYFTYSHETRFVESYSIFCGWHNDRCLKQCVLNLQEKYDCGAMTLGEWKIILNYLGSTGKWKLTLI